MIWHNQLTKEQQEIQNLIDSDKHFNFIDIQNIMNKYKRLKQRKEKLIKINDLA